MCIMTVTIDLRTTPDDDVRALVTELEDDLASRYPVEQRHGLAVEALFHPHIRFFVASEDGRALGCGGVALFPPFAEVKRMYVRPEARGKRVADALLARIEAEVRAAGITDLKLETGTEQHAAMRFYEKAGFARCGSFGAYSNMATEQVVGSVFMEKAL